MGLGRSGTRAAVAGASLEAELDASAIDVLTSARRPLTWYLAQLPAVLPGSIVGMTAPELAAIAAADIACGGVAPRSVRRTAPSMAVRDLVTALRSHDYALVVIGNSGKPRELRLVSSLLDAALVHCPAYAVSPET